MRKRKHAKPKRKSTYHPGRRRKRMMNFAVVMVALMALSLILSNYTRRATPPNFKTQTSHSVPAKAPARGGLGL